VALGAGAISLLLLICSVAIHPFGSVKQQEARSQPAINDLTVSPEVKAILERSCVDCHSNHAAWPWYSYVAPVSWLVERDVRRGRDRLNLSHWSQYAFEQRRKLLADIASAVENREMPLPQYTVMHRAAKLSDADRDAVYRWAGVERRRMGSSQQGR
jgi:hypothetical protein